MSLNPGARLGPYEILSPLGAGGMGEVYAARDTRLDRSVAIKVLPEILENDPERRARFEREAKLLASLNHPNVATLYGFDSEKGVGYLAMEMVPGETFAERIQKGPIPLDELLPLFIQIAHGLEAAHANGVLHRDLKPANIKITPDHKVKILDFGLAKAVTAMTEASPGLSNSPTMTTAATIRGEIMGTAGYMSPEQARGRDLDRRTDVWAFGCVLYEALTGHSPFQGDTITDTLAAIVRADPEWERLPADVPRPLRRVLRRCLEKDAKKRLHDIADARIELEEILAGGAPDEDGPAVLAAPAAKRRPAWQLAVPAALLAALITFAVTSLLSRPAPPPAPAQRFMVAEAELTGASTPTVSDDGRTIAYGVTTEGKRMIYRRPLDSFEAVPIPGTEGGKGPFFSPDGRWLGFVTDDAVKKVLTSGGTAITLCSVQGATSGAWGPDGTIVFALGNGGWDGKTVLGRISESGGRPEPLLATDANDPEVESWLPEILPGGRTILYSTRTSSGWNVIAMLPDGSKKTLIPGAFDARWDPRGYLVYMDTEGSVLMAARFDPKELELAGAGVPISDPLDDWHCFDMSPEGTLVYVPGGDDALNVVMLADPSGQVSPLVETPGTWVQPRISPDGRRVVIRKTATNCDLWIQDRARGVLSRLTLEGDNHDPVWSPDGSRIAVHSNGAGSTGLLLLSADGSGSSTRVGDGPLELSPACWSRDGRTLICTATGSGTRTDIWTIPVDGSGPAAPFVQTEFHDTDPALSPDHDWMAYASDESGLYQVYLKTFPGPGPRIQVSTDGGRFPVWSASGRALYFESEDHLMVVDVKPGAQPEVGVPRILFTGLELRSTRSFDPIPDGSGFVLTRTLAGTSKFKKVLVVQNWESGIEGAGVVPRSH